MSGMNNLSPIVNSLDLGGIFVIDSRLEHTSVMRQVIDIGASIGLPEATLDNQNTDFLFLGETSRSRQACKPTSNDDVVVDFVLNISRVVDDIVIHRLVFGKTQYRFRGAIIRYSFRDSKKDNKKQGEKGFHDGIAGCDQSFAEIREKGQHIRV